MSSSIHAANNDKTSKVATPLLIKDLGSRYSSAYYSPRIDTLAESDSK